MHLVRKLILSSFFVEIVFYLRVILSTIIFNLMKIRFFVVALLSLNAITLISQTCKEVIGYYPNWQWYDRAKLVNASSIMYSKYSIINYCFLKPEASGLISSTDSWADENLLKGQINWSTTPTSYYPNTSVIDLAHNAGTKVMVSIGGWTLSDNFPGIAADANKRALFASECNRLIRTYNFDGIDIDWEYPGFADHSGTSSDKHNFTLLMQQIRDSLTTLGAGQGKTYLLSACFSADPLKMNDIEWNIVPSIIDMINIMSYDFFGAWDCLANHNSPLYAPASGDPAFNLHSAFTRLTTQYGVASSKINLGVAFYGRSQTGATALHQTTNCGTDNITFSDDLGSPLYYNIVKQMSLFNYFWDNTAKVPYLIGKSTGSAVGTFVSYDDKPAVAMKAQYIANHNARGAIIWEITGDYLETSPGSGIIAGTPLLDTMNYVFCHSTVTGIANQNGSAVIDVYPNPVKSLVTINSKELILTRAVLFDCKGAEVIAIDNDKAQFSLNLSQLPAGIYLLKLIGDDSVVTKKLVKED